MKETRTVEYKESIDTNSFLKTVSAFANYSGGQIIFGIADDGTIQGISDPIHSTLSLENKIDDSLKPVPAYSLEINKDSTITLHVEKGPFTPYLYKGKAYKRNDTATIEVNWLELNRLVLEGMNQTYEEQVSFLQDLTFVELNKEFCQILGIEKITDDILKTLGLYTNDKFNNAAALLADHNRYLGIDIIRYGKNINELMDRNTDDNVSIFRMYHNAIAFFDKYYTYEEIKGNQRMKKELIPNLAYREVIANALIHRLWDIQSRIRISMFEDRIEVTSPGGLPAGIDEEEYLNGQVSFLRNPIIGNIFFRLGYIEMFGSGIRRIKESYRNSLSEPEFKIFNNSITVVLPILINTTEVTDDEQIILNFMSIQKLSRTEIGRMTDFNKNKTIRLLNSLINKGLISKSGSGPNTKYSLSKK
ncbi:MAG: ATP-binding protein [Erysipelotrichaceae bacterium]|nr:ATP-binding protein [Erysipelotrichaceae bacterium]